MIDGDCGDFGLGVDVDPFHFYCWTGLSDGEFIAEEAEGVGLGMTRYGWVWLGRGLAGLMKALLLLNGFDGLRIVLC